jgi:hypothetical protein
MKVWEGGEGRENTDKRVRREGREWGATVFFLPSTLPSTYKKVREVNLSIIKSLSTPEKLFAEKSLI